VRNTLISLTLLTILIQPCVAEMDWEHLVLIESATDQTRAVEVLKAGLYNVQYDANMRVGDYVRTASDRQNPLLEHISRYKMDQYYLTDGTVEYGFYLSLTPSILSLLMPATKPVQLVVPMLCPTCNQDWPAGKQPPGGLQLKPKAIEETHYTGIVIDCRGMDITPCLFPRILNEKQQEVFSVDFADQEMVLERGVVIYANSEGSITQRIGNNPLRIRAITVMGDGRTDVKISSREAQRIHGSQNNLTLLRECRVAIISGQ
jgi:hypothetical protein